MILVVGATAFFGRQTVETLAARGVPVRALTRNPAAAALPAGVQVVRGDLTDPASITPALDGVTALLLVMPYGLDASALLQRAAGRRIVVLSSGAVPGQDVIAGYHAGLERAAAEATPAWTALRILFPAINSLSYAHQLTHGDAVHVPYPRSSSTAVHERDVAEAAVAVLTGTLHDGHASTQTSSPHDGRVDTLIGSPADNHVDTLTTSPHDGHVDSSGHDGHVDSLTGSRRDGRVDTLTGSRRDGRVDTLTGSHQDGRVDTLTGSHQDGRVDTLTGSPHDGRVYTLTGPAALTQAEQVAAIGAALGRPLRAEAADPAAVLSQLSAFLDGDFAAALLSLLERASHGPAAVTSTVEELTGHPARPYSQWIRDHIDEFRNQR